MVKNDAVYCTKLVKPCEQTWRVSSPDLTKLSAIHCFVLHLSVLFLLLHAGFYAISVQFSRSCNTTKKILNSAIDQWKRLISLRYVINTLNLYLLLFVENLLKLSALGILHEFVVLALNHLTMPPFINDAKTINLFKIYVLSLCYVAAYKRVLYQQYCSCKMTQLLSMSAWLIFLSEIIF